jgi:butyrate kinase
LPAAEFRVLAINPGSTSTKIALFVNEQAVLVKNLRHSDAEMAPFRSRPILDQQQFRAVHIEAELEPAGVSIVELNAVVGRGGLLPPLASGTYEVNRQMLDELRAAKRGEHASNLGAYLAHALAEKAGVRAYIVDPVSVDEWPEIARLSGTALLQRQSLSHALNSKAVAKRYAREQGKPYKSLRLIVAHLGSGISVSAHAGGRVIDATNSREEGAFSTERAGGVPAMQLLDLCFSGTYTRRQIDAMLCRDGGLQSYLGTKDLCEVERRIAAGDAHAATVFNAMAYQIAKEIGGMAAALSGQVDAMLFTGGMAHSERLVAKLSEYVQWIAPIVLYPGEDELQALAEGALRVLRGEEQALRFGTARGPSGSNAMAASARHP